MIEKKSERERRCKEQSEGDIDDDDDNVDDETTVDVCVKIALCEYERTHCNSNCRSPKDAKHEKKTSSYIHMRFYLSLFEFK